MSEPLPHYQFPLDRSRINFTRLRPYVYVLLQMALEAQRLTPFPQILGETLLAYLQPVNEISAIEAEQKLCEWGIPEFKSRLLISHLWLVMLSAADSLYGVAPIVLKAESEVRLGYKSAREYAVASEQALKYARASQLQQQKPTNHFGMDTANTVTQQELTSKKQQLEHAKETRRRKINRLEGLNHKLPVI